MMSEVKVAKEQVTQVSVWMKSGTEGSSCHLAAIAQCPYEGRTGDSMCSNDHCPAILPKNVYKHLQ